MPPPNTPEDWTHSRHLMKSWLYYLDLSVVLCKWKCSHLYKTLQIASSFHFTLNGPFPMLHRILLKNVYDSSTHVPSSEINPGWVWLCIFVNNSEHEYYCKISTSRRCEVKGIHSNTFDMHTARNILTIHIVTTEHDCVLCSTLPPPRVTILFHLCQSDVCAWGGGSHSWFVLTYISMITTEAEHFSFLSIVERKHAVLKPGYSF
jgi:hypothetical protein